MDRHFRHWTPDIFAFCEAQGFNDASSLVVDRLGMIETSRKVELVLDGSNPTAHAVFEAGLSSFVLSVSLTWSMIIEPIRASEEEPQAGMFFVLRETVLPRLFMVVGRPL